MSHCLVVGAGRGLGAAIARRFAGEGFAVSLVARSRETLDAVAATLPKPAGCWTADAGDPASLGEAVETAVAQSGPVDVLVYNAVSVTPGTPSKLGPEALIADFRASVAGVLVAVQAVLPGMRSQGRGTILLTGGGFALKPMAQFATIGVSKAAIRNLASSLADELAPEGIHAATVTIAGIIKEGTPFSPERIAGQFWELHAQPRETWEVERLYRPEV
ncbi:MAG: SDR family NAD(P)-dependent oxidoreductase [Pseudomonadota bacterium]|nr:SDR family NAD(P)-dependent oxidoreductase [Pseudomonadota bacterium]